MATLSPGPIASPLTVDEVGVVRIGTSRVTLDTLVHAYREGSTAEEIVQQFPTLALADVHAAVAYYLTHQSEVEVYLQQRHEEADEIRRHVAQASDQSGLRDRLLARQAALRTSK